MKIPTIVQPKLNKVVTLSKPSVPKAPGVQVTVEPVVEEAEVVPVVEEEEEVEPDVLMPPTVAIHCYKR